MKKSKKIMLLAGIVLSLVISTPAFSSGKKTIEENNQQILQELIAINSGIPLVKALEDNKITVENINKHVAGFKIVDSKLKSDKGDFVTYIIDDTEVSNPNKNTIIVIAITSSDAKLSKIKNLGDICVQVSPNGNVTKGVSSENVKNGYSIVGNVLSCKMKK